MSVNELLQTITGQRTMQFAPVVEDDDELSRSINNDPRVHENNWDLHEEIDANQLEAFWSDAVAELGVLEPEQSDDW